ncbi:MAG: ATP-binding protein [Clostridiales bacterium]|nr:ATP-binding protein [Clostridiales bacterium]
MKRFAMSELIDWKNRKSKKPLIIRGARQVGKTWLLKEFGKTMYKDYIYINFDDNPQMEKLFSLNLEPSRLIEGLSVYSGKAIDRETLLIFDEIQEVPNALNSLKYFYEDASEYQIVAAGSLLGIALHSGTSFPVGKVEFMDLYPMSFSEFLCATGYEKHAKNLAEGNLDFIGVIKSELIDLLKKYMFVGGMPEAVLSYSQNKNYAEVKKIHLQILGTYENDFSKHAPINIVPRIRMLWQSIPHQLAKENKKFIYGLVKEGSRAREYEIALMWLSDCGLIRQVKRVKKGSMPLKFYEDWHAFKLFILDVGLLCELSGIDAKVLVDRDDLLTEYKGAITEQFVLQQLVAIGITPYYWSNDTSDGEVDFVFQNETEIIPIEVKAAENLRAKSLKAFAAEYKIPKAVRTSLSDFRKDELIVNVPLYLIEFIKKYL